MNILIIEDERPAAERLRDGIRRFDPSITIHGPLKSVRESVAWISTHPAPDLALVDIQLSDGLSLEIFKTTPFSAPLIFTTAYDEYILEALECNTIDYLLKPVRQEKLEHALTKYLTLRRHFTGNLAEAFNVLSADSRRPRTRLIVRKGADFQALAIDDVAYLFTEKKIVFLVDRTGTRFIMDRPLGDYEGELDPVRFFRVNRQFLVHVGSVQKFRPMEKGKIALSLNPPVGGDVIISQETAPAFRKWIDR